MLFSLLRRSCSPAVPKSGSEGVRWASDSFCRVLGRLFLNSTALMKPESNKLEGVRWACGLIKNLAQGEENAARIGKTEILECVVEIIRATTVVPSRWKSDSLEEFSRFAKNEENAALIGKTDISKQQNTAAPASHWRLNSLEDFSLFVVLNLAQWPVSREALIEASAVDVIKPVMTEGELKGLETTMACAFLEAPWSAFLES